MSEPIHYQIDETAFDPEQLPADARTVGSASFRSHVKAFFERQYGGMPGETTVSFENGKINVTWMPREADENPAAVIMRLLETGRYSEAAPLLETAIQANPRDHQSLYNLGMVYSDMGRLPEAMGLLRRATEVEPENANAWVALGIAALRSKDNDAARAALEHAISIDGDNAFALRSLGTLCLMDKDKDIDRALQFLRRAVALLRTDPVSRLTLAQALIEQNPEQNAAEAEALFRAVLAMSPNAEVAKKAEAGLTVIAQAKFRGEADGDIRQDATQYCLDALDRFEGMDRDTLLPIVMEMATLGEGGLPVNDPSKKFELRLLPGEYTALHIVCMLHVGLKCIDPDLDSGFDISREYAAALALHTPRN
ncbi:MAG: hypothetical protein EHM62_00505 [Methylococcus sp.]|nr:MAG: hypothetical protein EHM62_00505 [Methylococcus sp.]